MHVKYCFTYLTNFVNIVLLVSGLKILPRFCFGVFNPLTKTFQHYKIYHTRLHETVLSISSSISIFVIFVVAYFCILCLLLPLMFIMLVLVVYCYFCSICKNKLHLNTFTYFTNV